LAENINWSEVEEYWLEEADNDLKVAGNLFEREDYSYSLFLVILRLKNCSRLFI